MNNGNPMAEQMIQALELLEDMVIPGSETLDIRSKEQVLSVFC
jgi:hypothetical protein